MGIFHSTTEHFSGANMQACSMACRGTWEGLRKRGASPELLTKLWSTFPAQLAGLAQRKGALIAGYDADIVVSCLSLPGYRSLSFRRPLKWDILPGTRMLWVALVWVH